jgi:hypothetical protein
MVSRLVLLAVVVGIGVGIYVIGKSVRGESNVVVTVAGLPARAAATVAETNLASAAAAASTYYTDHASYDGMTATALRSLEPELPPTLQVARADATSYCIEDDLSGEQAHLDGPGGTATAGPCA